MSSPPPPSRRAVQELRDRGDLGGEATYQVLSAAFATAARRVPAGLVTDDGSREKVEDAFSRFLLAKLTTLPEELVLKDSDDDIRKLVYAAAQYWLQDRARSKTDHGSHRHTLERLMRGHPTFHQRPGTPTLWGLAGASSEYGGDDARLLRAAATVTDIRAGRAGNDEQRPGLAPRADLARLLEAVLAAAGGTSRLASSRTSSSTGCARSRRAWRASTGTRPGTRAARADLGGRWRR